MNRRDFIISTAAAAGAVLPASSAPLSPQSPTVRKRALMKLGCQSGPTSDQRLQFFARHGIRNIFAVLEISDKDHRYPYMMMPEHVPFHPDDPGGSQAFAFAYGYTRALIQAVDQLG